VGAGVHNLDADYTDWLGVVEIDFGSVQRAQRLRFRMPPSANRNQSIKQGEDGCFFWPGLWVQVSEDGVDYYDVSPLLYKIRARPTELVDIQYSQITRPKFQYMRIYCAPFKQGISNQHDPAIGLAEIEVYFEEYYQVVKTAYALEHAITGVNTGTETFTVAGDHREAFPAGSALEVYGSTGNDGVWTVASTALNGGNTEITVEEDVTDATVDGTISPAYTYTDHLAATPHYWRRAKPDLMTRFGGRHKTKGDLDLTGQANEYLAHDIALSFLEESARLFQRVEYTGVIDPRVRLYDTVLVNDEYNGDVGSILVEGVRRSRDGVRISGTNYLAEELKNS